MTRKWGSCYTSGVLTLAADLADHEPGFQDFIIAHELLHLRVPNHGRLFKALMSGFRRGMSDYASLIRPTFVQATTFRRGTPRRNWICPLIPRT